jgi:hypothetical protein
MPSFFPVCQLHPFLYRHPHSCELSLVSWEVVMRFVFGLLPPCKISIWAQFGRVVFSFVHSLFQRFFENCSRICSASKLFMDMLLFNVRSLSWLRHCTTKQISFPSSLNSLLSPLIWKLRWKDKHWEAGLSYLRSGVSGIPPGLCLIHDFVKFTMLVSSMFSPFISLTW